MTIYIRFAGEPVFGDQALAGIIGPRGKAAWVGMAEEDNPDTGEPYTDAPTVAAMVEYLGARAEEAVSVFRDEAAASAAAALASEESATLSEANVAAMVTQPTVAAQLWATAGNVRGLSSLTGSFDGQRGQVFIGDSGSHTDPVTNLTVQNAGVYQWVAASSKWTWVSEGEPASILADRTAGSYEIGLLPFDSTAITDADGDRVGLSFANGQNGDNTGSDSDAVFKVSDYIGLSKIHAGARVRCRVEFTLSTNFRPTITPFLQVRRDGITSALTLASQPSTTEYAIIQNERVGNVRYIALDFIATGTEELAAPFLRFSGTNSQGGETITYRDHRFSLVSRTDNTVALQTQQLGGAIRSAALAGSDNAYERALSPIPVSAVETVGPAGDYATFREGYSGLGSGELTARKDLVIAAGIFDHDAAQPGDLTYILPRYTNIIGGDAPHRCIIRNFQADSVDPADTATNEPIRIWYSSEHRDHRRESKNTRYTDHNDPSGTTPDQTILYDGMEVVHYGNQGAVDYQTGLGGSGNPAGVWSLSRPFGYGSSSGWVLDHRNGYAQGYKYVFGFHDQIDFDKANTVSVTDHVLVATSPEDAIYAYRFSVYGSGVASKLNFRGVSCNGDMQIVFGPWLSENPDNQPADPAWQFQIRTQSHDPMKAVTSGTMRALKIASTSTAPGSSIDLTGSTQALLDAWFGDVYKRPGSGGLAGYVFGYNNISAATVGVSAININALGKRAGNRTSSPWVLSVSVNGGAAVTVTFNSDLTNVSNSTILATINAALGSAATASEYNLVERVRPLFVGEESPRYNSDTVALPWRSWVAAADSIRRVRLMTAADSPSRSGGSVHGRLTNDYGDDIYPGATGRIKHGGVWGAADLIINGSPTLTYGDLLEIDPANPGQLVKNNYSIRPVLMCAGPDLFTRV